MTATEFWMIIILVPSAFILSEVIGQYIKMKLEHKWNEEQRRKNGW